jgi:hypothetical protein
LINHNNNKNKINFINLNKFFRTKKMEKINENKITFAIAEHENNETFHHGKFQKRTHITTNNFKDYIIHSIFSGNEAVQISNYFRLNHLYNKSNNNNNNYF